MPLRSLQVRLAASEAGVYPNPESEEQREVQEIVAAAQDEGQGSEKGSE